MGIKAMCFGMVISSYLALLINTHYTGKLSSLSPYKQFSVLLPIGIITAFSAFIGYKIGINVSSSLLQIITMLVTALSTYIGIMLLVQRPLLISLKNALKI
jgi:teichuronic acid exporter